MRLLAAALDVLCAPIDRRWLEEQRFEAAINDGALFDTIKLIHICEPSREPLVPWGVGRADDRAVAFASLMELAERGSTARFDRAAAGRIFGAMRQVGLTSWYPTVGFEVDRGSSSACEMSLYSENRPSEAGTALVEEFQLPPLPYPVERLYAVGIDFFSDTRHRLKFYFKLPSHLADGLSADVADGFWPEDVLVLVRAEDGAYGTDRKAYVTMIDAPLGRMQVRTLDAHVVGGRLRTLVDAVLPAAPEHWLSFVSASPEKAEIYFGAD
jgi:hypothetical protein